MTREPMTAEGFKRLKDELERLKAVERPAVIEAIAEARSHGDLSENAEYDAAKEKQGMIEGRIAEIDHKLAIAEVIDVSTLSGDKITFGATVTLFDLESEKEIQYQIVGADETDLARGRISVRSPMARALIGKSVSDEVTLNAPGGTREFEIQDVAFR
ncbi:MAG: transcription elongation factor GreA [Nitrospirota bacterium]|nr:transcription elongation factor GreA [Nitrospirota bacterium]